MFGQLVDWLFGRSFVITNQLGAETMFLPGTIHEVKGQRWRVTRCLPLRGSKRGTIYVHGRKVR